MFYIRESERSESERERKMDRLRDRVPFRNFCISRREEERWRMEAEV